METKSQYRKIKRERWTEWKNPFETWHFGRDTEENICKIEPYKVILDIKKDSSQ